jgi:peptidoglycan-associated lipoprotein
MTSPRTAALCACLGMAAIVAGCAKRQVRPPETTNEPIQTEAPRIPTDEDVFSEAEMDPTAKAVLQPVYFGYDSWTLDGAATQTLRAIGAYLRDRPGARLLVEGHCDERGSAEYNMALGERRASAVRDWLVAYGIDRDRLETTSYGEERLTAYGCEAESCHAQNRRATWVLLSKAEEPVSLSPK